MGDVINKKGKITIQLFDWISFVVICFVLSNFGKTDPGEMIFLFVYENLLMFVVFYLFVVVVTPFHLLYVQKKSISNEFEFFVTKFVQYALFGFIIMCIALIPFIFLNQLSIELLISYMTDNDYDYQSFVLFEGQDIFIDNWRKFEQIFNIKFKFVMLFFAIRYFILLLLNFFFHPSYDSNTSVSVLGIFRLISNVILGPISILMAMVALVILTAVFGKATWIVLTSLAIFKLLFNLLSNRLTQFLESI